MSTSEGTPKDGSINISGINGGRIAFNAGSGSFQGDAIAGDNIIRETTTTSASTVTYGFQQETDKTVFLEQIETLRKTLRELKNAIDGLDELNEDEKDDVTMEILQQTKELNAVKKTAEETPVCKEAPKEKAELVGKCLDKTTTLMGKLKKMVEATSSASEKIIPAIVDALPLLASVRRLFGLP